MQYPGHIVKLGEPDPAIVVALKQALSARGYQPASMAGVFDTDLKSLVSLFQSQNGDIEGRPLKADGIVGPLTWGTLFGAQSAAAAANSVASAALAVAIGEIGTLEVPLGSNRGPKVDIYQRTAGLHVPPGYFWCMAFVYYCFETASPGAANPFPKTAGCLDAWNKVSAATPKRILSRARAIADPTLVRPGMVFILDFGNGYGHTGFIRSVTGGALRTVEGNSDPAGSNNGTGVFDLNRRSVMDAKLKGFIDFT